MELVSLFAGIGGFDLGFRAAGYQSTLLCEIDASATAVLRARFPEAEVFADVAELAHLPSDTAVLTAGFPCQDLSQAGRTAGIAGDRSGLVDHVFRLLRAHPVPTVVLENVSFMLQLDGGSAMRRLANEFEALGYRWAYRTVDSLSFVPQRRQRVFFVASRGELDPSAVLFADEVTAIEERTELSTHAHGFYWTEGTRGLGWAPDAVPTLKGGSAVGIPSPPAIVLPNGTIITPDIRDAERLQGFPSDWTLGAAQGARLGARWKLVGNAVSVPAAAWLASRIAAPGDYDGSRDASWPSTRAWPRAARVVDGERRAVIVGSRPAARSPVGLADFLHHPGSPLSTKAASGFLRRAEASSLRFREGFLELVREHIERVAGRPALLAAE